MQVDNTATGTVVTTPASPAPTPHPLQSTWSFWEHRRNKAGNVVESADASYLAGIQQLCSVSTVEEFWQAFTYLPLPSKFFFDGNVRHDFVDRSVEGFSLFRENVQPMWEDEGTLILIECFIILSILSFLFFLHKHMFIEGLLCVQPSTLYACQSYIDSTCSWILPSLFVLLLFKLKQQQTLMVVNGFFVVTCHLQILICIGRIQS